MKRLRFLLTTITILLSLSFSQFVDVKVDLDIRQLRGERERKLLLSFEDRIQSYFLSTEFAPEATDIEMVLDIHFVIESVSIKGNEASVSAQVLASNRLDQQYFTNGVEFPYSQGQSIFFTPSFDNLASLLDYFAFLIIAGELDTWDYLGGDIYYKKAEDISLEGKETAGSRGWENRWKNCRLIMDNHYLRSAKLHFYTALDMFNSKEYIPKELKTSLTKFDEMLIGIYNEIGTERNTMLFLNAHAEEIGKMLSAMKMIDSLEFLSNFDSENKKVYQSYFNTDE